MNKAAVSGYSGRLKIFTLILGAIVIGLASHSAFYKSVKEHEVFFYSVVACFIISLIFLILAFIGIMEGDIFGKLDLLYHVIAGILLIATAIAFIIDVSNTGDCRGACKSAFAERISAGALTLLNALFYLYIAKIA